MAGQKMNEIENLMKNIKFLRKKYGLSKNKMAKIMGIGVDSLNKIEREELPQRLGVDILFHLEKHFSIPVCDLFKDLL